jgi:hypothetical protein
MVQRAAFFGPLRAVDEFERQRPCLSGIDDILSGRFCHPERRRHGGRPRRDVPALASRFFMTALRGSLLRRQMRS